MKTAIHFYLLSVSLVYDSFQIFYIENLLLLVLQQINKHKNTYLQQFAATGTTAN